MPELVRITEYPQSEEVETSRWAGIPLSQSRYEAMACPHLYRETIMGNRHGNTPAARGTEIHDFLADYVDHLVGMDLNDDHPWFDAQLQGRGFSEGAREILDDIKHAIRVEPQQVLSIEERLYLDDNFQPVKTPFEAAYEGKPDLVLLDGRNAVIPDYKSQFQIEGADTFQGGFYALLVMLHYPFVERVIFELHFLRWNKRRQAEYLRSDIPTLKQAVENARRRQLDLHVMIEQGINGRAMPAYPGAHCVGCPLLHGDCPIRDNPFSASTEDALQFILWAQQAIKIRRQVIVAALNEQGETLDGMGGQIVVKDANGNQSFAEFRQIDKSAYPLNDTTPVLEQWKKQSGEDISGKLRIGATELNSLAKAKKRAPLREALDAVKEITPQTKLVISGEEQE